MRTEAEINELLDSKLPDGADGESRWPAMTYEQGVQAMADWTMGLTDNNPLAD